MNKPAKFLITLALISSMLACSVLPPQLNKSSEIIFTDEKPIVVLDTGNSEHPRIVLYKGGEAIVPDFDANQIGEIVGVHGATFIALDGNSIYLYFENGMPVRAIVDGHLIQFENFTGDTVDITFVSPNGTVTQQEKVPFDSNQIPAIGSQSSAHLASIVRLPNNNDIDWLPFIQNATTAFFCAAAVTATIVPSGGTSAVILGAGCAILAYNAYLAIANKEPPVSVENADIVISGAGCALGVAKKDPLAVKDCADAVIDTVEVVKKETQGTEQKLVTLIGANPNTKSELEIETTIERVATPTTEIQREDSRYGCDISQLTPIEKLHCGKKNYTIVEATVTNNTSGKCNPSGSNYGTIQTWYFSYDDNGNLLGFEKIEENKYNYVDSSGRLWVYEFSLKGFTTTSDTYINGVFLCTWTNWYEIAE